MVLSIYNRIAVDVSNIKIEHVRINDDGKYEYTMPSKLNSVLTLNANIDQTGKELIEDLVMTMFEEGVAVLVATDTTADPRETDSYDVLKMRVGVVKEWFPKNVRVSVYNEQTGRREEILLDKRCVAVIKNPFYATMNEPNSDLQRLLKSISRLEKLNNEAASGKLNLLVQLPYPINQERRKNQADARRAELEAQLVDTKYGIGYIDASEKIVQLNKTLDNQIYQQVQDLTKSIYNQLGLTESIFNGTADEQTTINYYNRTLVPVLSTITDNIKRTFLSMAARTQKQSVMFFRDQFQIVPAEKLAQIADTLTRNAIASSNEMRSVIGWKPVNDVAADELRNKNLNQTDNETAPIVGEDGVSYNPRGDTVNIGRDRVNSVLSRL